MYAVRKSSFVNECSSALAAAAGNDADDDIIILFYTVTNTSVL